MIQILVVNSGSSSLKYQLLDMVSEAVLASGLIERIGQSEGALVHATGEGEWMREQPVPDHRAAFSAMLGAFDRRGPDLAPRAVGHRVVHGGSLFQDPTLLTAEVIAQIEELSPLAPLHNPANLEGIRAARAAFPDIPHIAVFDTAFHRTVPAEAAVYAIDAEVAARHRIARYGFHGTSHQYVSRAAAAFLGRPLEELRQIVFHLGNGASVTAIDAGRSVETSMGFTPLEGLVMGTRSGDLDPAVLLYLMRTAGYEADGLDELLNRRSGLRGLAGASDMRDVLVRRAQGEEAASLAFDVYAHRLRHYAGAYIALLGGVDVVSFTAGVGENAAEVRQNALRGMEFLGIEIDPERNARHSSEPREISTDRSRVRVLVIPTNEELEIARQTREATQEGGTRNA